MKYLVLTAWIISTTALWAQMPADTQKIIPSQTVQLRDPHSVSISAEGLIYIADTGHHRVVAVDTMGKLIAETGGFGDAHGQFRWPRDVVANRGNAVWVLDYGNRRIERFTRSLEYQGTLTLIVPDDNTPHQPEVFTISPQSDLYVFDRDDGRLVRYDPLFRVQAEMGGGSGSQFVSAVAAMTFVSAQGLFWWERGGREVGHSDALLNPAHPYPLNFAPDDLHLASSDSCLWYGCSRGIFRQCSFTAPADTIIAPADLSRLGITHLAGLAVAPDHHLYVLDGGAAALFRVNLLRE
jgi:hypothetical protein